MTIERMLAQRSGRYFNWDLASDRKLLAKDPAFFEKECAGDTVHPPLVVLDELHKYARWKNYLKGTRDGYADRFAFMVMGSGRLDVYKRGGDSLLGRYVPLCLFPLTIAELAGKRATWTSFQRNLGELDGTDAGAKDTFQALLRLGGFPEPYLRGSDAFHRTWSAGRTERLVREDIRDATSLRELSLLEMLARLLPVMVRRPKRDRSSQIPSDLAFHLAEAGEETGMMTS